MKVFIAWTVLVVDLTWVGNNNRKVIFFRVGFRVGCRTEPTSVACNEAIFHQVEASETLPGDKGTPAELCCKQVWHEMNINECFWVPKKKIDHLNRIFNIPYRGGRRPTDGAILNLVRREIGGSGGFRLISVAMNHCLKIHNSKYEYCCVHSMSKLRAFSSYSHTLFVKITRTFMSVGTLLLVCLFVAFVHLWGALPELPWVSPIGLIPLIQRDFCDIVSLEWMKC